MYDRIVFDHFHYLVLTRKMVEVNQLEHGKEGLKNVCTKDGSVDRNGKPAVKERTGGWRCGMLLLGTFFLNLTLLCSCNRV